MSSVPPDLVALPHVTGDAERGTALKGQAVRGLPHDVAAVGETHHTVARDDIELLALEQIPQSVDDPVQGANEELGAFGELLADPLAEDAYEQLLDRSEIEQVRALLGSLNERERMILRARYGLDGPEQTLREVGERIGLSAERVRQIEDRALGKLRAGVSRGAAAETDSRGD